MLPNGQTYGPEQIVRRLPYIFLAILGVVLAKYYFLQSEEKGSNIEVLKLSKAGGKIGEMQDRMAFFKNSGKVIQAGYDKVREAVAATTNLHPLPMKIERDKG